MAAPRPGGRRGRPSALDTLLLTADRVLQRVVPPRDDQVAWLSEPDFVGNAFHLYRHARTTRPHLHHVWLVTGAESADRIAAELADANAASDGPLGSTTVLRRHSMRGYWARLRSRRVFHTHGVFPMDRAFGRDVVSLWHGMPIKAIGALNAVSPNPHPTFGTLHLASSIMFRTVIAAAFRAPLEDVLLTSLPRTDVLVRPHPLGPTCAEVQRALGVDGPLVLWLPTHRARAAGSGSHSDGPSGVASFVDDVEPHLWAWIDEAAAAVGATVVVKLHPDDPLNGVDGVPEAIRRCPQIRLLRSPQWLATGFELYDVLAHADGLVSDISSVVVDFVATDRPVALVGFDEATYDRALLVPVAALHHSRRLHHFASRAVVEDFFDRVVRQVGPDADDLSSWLADVPAGAGCDTVLGAVGL